MRVQILEVYVKTLPETDRRLLRKANRKVESAEQRLIADYTI
jgi:hypothetical protein